MTDSTDSHDGRLASTVRRLSGNGGNGAGGQLLALGSLVVALLSIVTSLLAASALPATVRIHWTFGTGPYYGPEFAPTVLVLSLFPALIGGVAIGAAVLDAVLGHAEEFAPARPYYVLAALVTLGALLVSQVTLVVANL